MSATYAALIAEGDRWLEQAIGTYRGGGSQAVAGAEGTIAAAYYARAQLEKPDTFAALLAASAAAQQAGGNGAATAAQMAEMVKETADRQAAKKSGRHPAGRNRAKATPPKEVPDDDPS